MVGAEQDMFLNKKLDEPICEICKGGKLLCGQKYCPIVQRLKFWRNTIESIKDSFLGTSPPAIFIGKFGYPRVNVGILSPPVEMESAEKLDSPEIWYQEQSTIRQILDYRSEMINSRTNYDVKRPKGNLLGTMQELSMAKKSIDIEVWLKSKPKFKFSVNNFSPPIGNPAIIKEAKITENVKIPRKVDEVVSDTDLKAENATNLLYKHGVQISKIEKIFSVGLLGLPFQRKLVPTRWSITGVDDIIGKNLRQKIKTFQELSEIQVFCNHYEIIFLPRNYEYELVEIKHPKSVWNPYGKYAAIYSDYESYWGRKDYAFATGGAFYAGRLSVLEYLEKIRRQASILIIREVLPAYYAPLGIWQMRETIRGAFSRKPILFDDFDKALKNVSNRLITPMKKILTKSKLFQNIKKQKKIKEFF
jgi:hypothetical protein